MKQIAIKKHFSYFTTDSSEIEECVFDERMEKLNEELRELLNKYDVTLLEHETCFIPMDKMSLCYCDKCNNLMINRDKNPARFDGNKSYSDLTFVILDGGTHNDMDLCEECLPITHRWGHFS